MLVTDINHEGAVIRVASAHETVVGQHVFHAMTSRSGWFVVRAGTEGDQLAVLAGPMASREDAQKTFREIVTAARRRERPGARPPALSATPAPTPGPTGDIPLPAPLDEFRVALRAEIDAAQRSGVGSVPILNGRVIARRGEETQYLFRLESTITGPDDVVADLVLPGGRRISANIISVEGLAVTISVGEDLGEFVPRASLRADLTLLLRKLIERIEKLATKPNPAADRLLGRRPPSGESADVAPLAELDPSQHEALSRIVGWDTTFVWGPPGTGKTRTIGAAAAEFHRLQRSLLIVSHTNVAVDQALKAIRDFLGSLPDDGSVIRVGAPRDPSFPPELLAKTYVDRLSAELVAERETLTVEQSEVQRRIDAARLSLDLIEWVQVAGPELRAQRVELQSTQALERKAAEATMELRRLEAEDTEWRTRRAAARRAQERESAERSLAAEVAEAEKLRSAFQAILATREAAAADGQLRLEQSVSTGRIMRAWRRLPDPERQRAVVADLLHASDGMRHQVSKSGAQVQALRDQREVVARELNEFRAAYAAPPADVLAAADRRDEQVSQARRVLETTKASCRERRQHLTDALVGRFDAVRQLRPSPGAWPKTAEAFLDELDAMRAIASERISGLDQQTIRNEIERDTARAREIQARLATIGDELQKVEQLVIARARVVATTLTRAYLRDSIQMRRFDTVLLDEASMAPIPALWAAAALADVGVVAVGDFEQLPPIVQSTDPLALKWLGRDIFDAGGAHPAPGAPRPPHFVSLRGQHRMRPEISAIANQLVYRGLFHDMARTTDETALDTWFDRTWGPDAPVLLVDTEGLNAWVTSGGRQRSRFNFISAVLTVGISRRMLRPDRPEFREGDRPRILIVAPYRPHAQLVSLLLKDGVATSEVIAGTVHAFQGNEADVVLFDLVNDDPHRLVGLFNAQQDYQNQRLLNVALTRARRRLIVVGDFKFARLHANPASFLRKLVDFLLARYPRVEAGALGVEHLAATVAKVMMRQGSESAPLEEWLLVNQDDFFGLLADDLAAAKDRVVIFSPYMTYRRIGELEPHLRAAADRGVRVYVVTKLPTERNATEKAECALIEEALERWGVSVLHKRVMHEKLVFIDDDVLWSGSLNPLSQSASQEIMERRRSDEVVQGFWKQMHLDTIINAYEAGDGRCPIDGGEMVTAEGTDGPYWMCETPGCHRRSIEVPAPRNGVITCASCGQPVKFGRWGQQAAWRCTANARHHQPVSKSHLRLPKMRALVPPAELRNLENGSSPH